MALLTSQGGCLRSSGLSLALSVLMMEAVGAFRLNLPVREREKGCVVVRL